MDPLSVTTEAAMLALKGTDNTLIKQAEAYLRVFLNKKAAAPTLFVLLQSSGDSYVRNLASVLLRPKMISFWNKLKTPELKGQVQSTLLARLAEEPIRGVKKAVVSLIVALGKALLPSGMWPQLATVIDAASKSPDEEVRELDMILVRDLLESLGPQQAGALAESFKSVILTAAGDLSSRRARGAALSALGLLLRVVDMDGSRRGLAALKDTVPVMMTMTTRCLDDLQEDAVADALATIDDLLYRDSPLLSSHIEPISHFLIACLANDRLEERTQDVAASALTNVMGIKPKTFVKKKLFDALLPVVLHGMSRYDAEQEHDQLIEARESGVELSDYVDSSIWNISGRVLDAAAIYLPAKHVMEKVSIAAAAAMGHATPAVRHAAIMALAIISEGCRDEIAPQLQTLLEAALRFERDPDPAVREAVLAMMSTFAEFVNPRILHYHGLILPAVGRMIMAEPDSPWIVERACQVVECFVDGLDRDVLKPYLEGLLTLLAGQLRRPGLPDFVSEMVVAALGSVVVGAGPYIKPFAAGLLDSLIPLTEAVEPKLARLRGHATECIGHVSVAAGKEICRPHLARLMASIAASVGMESMELRERTFVGVEALVEAFGEELAPMIPGLVKVLREVIVSSEFLEISERQDEASAAVADALGRLAGEEDEDAADGAGGGAGAGGDDEESEDDDDDSEDEGNLDFRVHTAAVELKATALSTLSYIARHCPTSFAPFLLDAVKLLEDHVRAFHCKLRQRAVLGLASLMASLLATRPPLPPKSPEEPATMATEVREVFDRVMFAITEVMRLEGDPDTVSSACVAVQTICKDTGMAAVTTHHAVLMRELYKIGRGQARCQRVNDDGEGGHAYDEAAEADGSAALDPKSAAAVIAAAAAGAGFSMGGVAGAVGGAGAAPSAAAGAGEDRRAGRSGGGGGGGDGDDDDEVDRALIDEATDAVMMIAKAMRGYFGMYLPEVVRIWGAFSKPSRSYLDRLMVVGLWADLAEGVGSTFNPFVPTILPSVVSGATDPNPEVRRNSLFCIGALIQYCTDAARTELPALLRAVHTNLAIARNGNMEEDLPLDNAVSAACKALVAVPDAVPLAAALPPILAQLPIRGDYEESKYVFGCLMRLLTDEKPEIMAHLPALLAVVAQSVGPTARTPADVQQGIIAASLRAVAASGSPAAQAALRAAMASLSEEHRGKLTAFLAGTA